MRVKWRSSPHGLKKGARLMGEWIPVADNVKDTKDEKVGSWLNGYEVDAQVGG